MHCKTSIAAVAERNEARRVARIAAVGLDQRTVGEMEWKLRAERAEAALAGIADAIAGARRNINPFDDPHLDYLGDMREDVWKLSYIANEYKSALAEAQRDAERYRWMRDGFIISAVDVHEITLDADEMNAEQFDAAIDAARGGGASPAVREPGSQESAAVGVDRPGGA